MKNILCSALLLCNLMTSFAQAPPGFRYQSVARNSSGQPLAKAAISLRLSLHDLAPAGSVIYRETHQVTTNEFGAFSVSVGTGTVMTGTFAAVNWGGGAKYLEVEADFSGGTNFTGMGVSQLLSVPYALYSQNGTPGPKGDKGDPGLPGAKGDKGDPGNAAAVDGSETKITAGTNVTVTGNGTVASPYLVNATGGSGGGWGLTGNGGTINGTHFVGTTDAVPLNIGTNNKTVMYVTTGGAVGINTKTPAGNLHITDTEIVGNGIDDDNDGFIDESGGIDELVFTRDGFLGVGVVNPEASLHVVGSLRFAGAGSPAAGKVLTSDAVGNATWQLSPNVPPGTTTGQMMYWNGSSWILLPPGSDNQVLRFCLGVPMWVSGTCPIDSDGDGTPDDQDSCPQDPTCQ